MNLLLHGIGRPKARARSPWTTALGRTPGKHYSMVLTNPPFGKKSSVTIVDADGETAARDADHRARRLLGDHLEQAAQLRAAREDAAEDHGRAAVVVPDNVLFEGGAGETVRRELLHECDVHTLLRLPTGIFYAQGVKANVLFFDRKPRLDSPWTKELWVYDLRTNQHFTLKQNPLTLDAPRRTSSRRTTPDNRHHRMESERFHRFTYDELVARDKANLDIFWLRDDSLEDADPSCHPR